MEIDRNNKLQEAYKNIPKIYNLTDILEFVELLKQLNSHL